MDPSSAAPSPLPTTSQPSSVLPENGLQTDPKMISSPLDQQKLEQLITEKLNTFEGVAGKQEIRQMMKEVIQDFLHNVDKTKNFYTQSTPLTPGQAPKDPSGAFSHLPDGSAKEFGADLLKKHLGSKLDGANDPANTPSPAAMGVQNPVPQVFSSNAAQQAVHVSRDAAQMIADIANQIVDRIQVNTNSLANMQEVRISFGNNILPQTDVLINLTGNQLNITFVAGSQQAAQFLSQQNLSQLQSTLKAKLGDDKTLNVSLKREDNEDLSADSTLTDRAVTRGEQADGFSGF